MDHSDFGKHGKSRRLEYLHHDINDVPRIFHGWPFFSRPISSNKPKSHRTKQQEQEEQQQTKEEKKGIAGRWFSIFQDPHL